LTKDSGLNSTLYSTDMPKHEKFSHKRTGLGRPKNKKHATGKAVCDDHALHWAQLKAAILFPCVLNA